MKLFCQSETNLRVTSELSTLESDFFHLFEVILRAHNLHVCIILFLLLDVFLFNLITGNSILFLLFF
jgi:hypothetical protein